MEFVKNFHRSVIRRYNFLHFLEFCEIDRAIPKRGHEIGRLFMIGSRK